MLRAGGGRAGGRGGGNAMRKTLVREGGREEAGRRDSSPVISVAPEGGNGVLYSRHWYQREFKSRQKGGTVEGAIGRAVLRSAEVFFWDVESGFELEAASSFVPDENPQRVERESLVKCPCLRT